MLHLSSRNLYELLRRADPERLSENIQNLLREISKSRGTCNLYSPRQITSQIRDPYKMRFNQMVILDIMFLKSSKKIWNLTSK